MSLLTSRVTFLSLTILSLSFFWEPESCCSATLSVPEDYATIQGAINSALDGDTVLVAPGDYRENLKILYKSVNIVSADGPARTTLDGNRLDAVVTFYACPGTPRLDGFRIVNGSRSGIHIVKSRPEINNCIVTRNSNWRGGGIYAHSGACPVVITNTEISGNTAMESGGGVTANQACIQIRNSKIL